MTIHRKDGFPAREPTAFVVCSHPPARCVGIGLLASGTGMVGLAAGLLALSPHRSSSGDVVTGVVLGALMVLALGVVATAVAWHFLVPAAPTTRSAQPQPSPLPRKGSVGAAAQLRRTG